MTPMRSVAGSWDEVPYEGSPRIIRICQGARRLPVAASIRPWTASAAPATIGVALEVPLNPVV